MRTDPLTDHAAQVIARQKQQQDIDRAEARALRLTVTPAQRVTRYTQTTAGVTTSMDGTILAVDGFNVIRPIIRVYQEA